ncbi:Na+/H+ antiporter family protein [Sediminitomix flava]|uniref:Sodium:proton antiporter n=1 Tax=Sediminitomix flava TaxID=379075 RepID=A0A315Z7N5_SEDFL|nr:Na+/H+ antiporter NhaC family protein [Sediminitomix flava]PWJ40867.1 hypothetical protein BC781_104127 [Sediminitomix flava]
MEILTNPVVVSVLTLIVLCLLRLNVILAILVSALVAGLVGDIPMTQSMTFLIAGMGDNAETALSYILLGALAVAINRTGAAAVLAHKISKVVGSKKSILLLIITLLACASQNLVPVHIAFIPILIPPLLPLMNKLKLDRRAVASALTFGLQTPYLVLPVGFGLIFHNVIKEQMHANGITSVETSMIWKSLWIPGIGMICGLLIALFISYRKSRIYKDIQIEGSVEHHETEFELKHIFCLVGAAVAFIIQLWTSSLPLGALAGLIVMLLSRAITWKEMEDVMQGGIGVMAFIAIVMLVAAGFGNVIRQTNGVEMLVQAVSSSVGDSQAFAAFLMLLVGLLVTMGIGTSFGTVPILATIYCPLGLELGFSIPAIIALIGVAGALGDAGSPASDSTLGPTSGLAIDKQHDHIWDTCVPTFMHYNIPLILFGVIAAVVL